MVDYKDIIAMEATRDENYFYVHWNIGKRCNYNCVYCPDNLHDMHSPHRDFENLKTIADKIEVNSPKPKVRIWFTGVEPTVNPAFSKLCKHLKSKNGWIVGLNTNGSRTANYYKQLIQQIDVIQFSSHFEYLETTDEFENKLVTAHAEAQKQQHKHISLNLMMEPEFWDKAVRLVKFCENNEIRYSMKRIRKKWGPNGYEPVYNPNQLEFLNNTEFRFKMLEQIDEA